MTLLAPRTGQATAGEFPILPSPVDRLHPLARGLVGYWAGLPGSTGGSRLIDWTDPGPNGKHGTLTSMDPATDWVPGDPRIGGYAVDFDGSNDYIITPTTPNVTTGITVETIIFSSSANGGFRTIGGQATSGTDINWRVELGSSSSNIGFGVRIDGTNETALAVSINEDTWLHLVGTWDGSNVRIYIKGKLAGGPTVAVGAINQSTKPISLGARSGGNINWTGKMALFAYWDYAFSASQVADRYSNPNALLRLRSRTVVSVPAVAGGQPTMKRWQQIKHMHNFRGAV